MKNIVVLGGTAVTSGGTLVPCGAPDRDVELVCVNTVRVYDPVRSADGTRVLVDRLWPRGIRKNDPRAGRWLKNVAPSTELRVWYNHDPAKFDEFARRYRAELDQPAAAAAFDELRALAAAGPVTLVTATKELALSHLAVLANLLEADR